MDFHPAELVARQARVAVCMPARDEAETIGPLVAQLAELREDGWFDQLVVMDDASQDGTAQIAAAAGADVHRCDELMVTFGSAGGKGDAIWRAQAVLDADLICFFDADLRSFTPDYVLGLVCPLLRDRSVQLVKGSFTRPLRIGDAVLQAGGGRVTELTAKPLLQTFYPELADLDQPLSGQFAIRAPALANLPVPTGYGVDLAILIGTWRSHGRAAVAETYLGELVTEHQSLAELSRVASAVLETLLAELARDGRLDRREVGHWAQVERPPFASCAAPCG